MQSNALEMIVMPVILTTVEILLICGLANVLFSQLNKGIVTLLDNLRRVRGAQSPSEPGFGPDWRRDAAGDWKRRAARDMVGSRHRG